MNKSYAMILSFLLCGAAASGYYISQEPSCPLRNRIKIPIAMSVYDYSLATTPLMKATIEGSLIKVKTLLKSGVDVNEYGGNWQHPQEGDGLTALMIAAAQADLPIMQELINAGADVNECVGSDFPHPGITVLQFAINSGSVDAVNLLIKAGVQANGFAGEGLNLFEYGGSTPNVRVLTALMYAISRYASIEMIEALVAGGADVNKPDPVFGWWTPLMIAAYQGNKPAVAVLLRLRADKSAQNVKDGNKTARDYACQHGHTEIVAMLND